jgi:hypothetical protein
MYPSTEYRLLTCPNCQLMTMCAGKKHITCSLIWLSFTNEVIVRDNAARQLFPHIQPVDYQTAVQLALAHLEADGVETTWSDALVSSQGDVTPLVLTTQDGTIIEQRQRLVEASSTRVYQTFTGLGGERGWLYFDWAWRLQYRPFSRPKYIISTS